MTNKTEIIPSLTYDYMTRECECRKDMDTRKVLRSVFCIIVSLALVFTGFNSNNTNSNYTITLSGIGAIILLYGLYLLFTSKSQWIYTPNGSVLSHNTYYYDLSVKTLLEEFVTSDKSCSALPQPCSLGSLMFEVFTTKDNEMACVQISVYKDFSYVPTSKPLMITDERAERIGQYIKLYS